MRRFIFFILLCAQWLALSGQSRNMVTHYDEEDGLPHAHITQLLQDRQGFLWLATWNGLCRYDGYEFCTFKSQMGDGCQMATDRFRDIALRPDGKIICRVDEGYYLFDTHTCRFSNLPDSEVAQATDDMRRFRMSQAGKTSDGSTYFVLTDRQGIRWTTTSFGLSKEVAMTPHAERISIEPQAEVKCLFADRQQRYWLCTKDGAVRVFSIADDRLLGFLGSDGLLHQRHVGFSSAVYCMYQTTDGSLWMGCKPGGLFRLQETSAGVFSITHFDSIANQDVYSLVEDRFGRLWVATLGGGLFYAEWSQDGKRQFRTPKGYPKDVAQRVRYLHLAHQGEVLMAATTEGLMVAQLEQDADAIRFHRHFRESDRSTSLSSSAMMDITTGPDGRIYISTESGGINRMEDANLLTDTLTFYHYTVDDNRLPSDVVLSLTSIPGKKMLMVSSHLLALIDSTGHYRQLDSHYFNTKYRFTDAHPIPLSNGRWLFGLKDGALITSSRQMSQPSYSPPLVLTSLSVQGGKRMMGVSYTDTLTLQPHERNVTVHFAAIDYGAPERINYAFRLQSHTPWNYIGHSRSATLLDLEPGTYQLAIRSTNADGLWQDNTRTLTLIVKPTFIESTWGRLFILTLMAGVLLAIVFTVWYIRHIKRKQRETLTAYLALLEKRDTPVRRATVKPQPENPGSDYDPVLKRVMSFIETNISDANLSVGDMAAAAATSRSGLQRKLRKMMGITPQDLLREARIKHACHLLLESDKSIAEVAYASGFTDPKYFSRCFKQSTGKSPSEYKNTSTMV